MTDEKMQKLHDEAQVIKHKLGVSLEVAVLILILEKVSNGNQ